MSLQINHVSINALDLQESVDFYIDLLGAQPIPTPNITVDDIEPVYRAAERRGAFEDRAFGNRLVELPGDVVQLYVRDPAGNLVEIDQPGADRLPEDLRSQLKGLWELNPQTDEQMGARLFVGDG